MDICLLLEEHLKYLKLFKSKSVKRLDLLHNDRISSNLENTISNFGWQMEPMEKCLTYSVPSREIVFQTACDGNGAAVTVCKKKIGNNYNND